MYFLLGAKNNKNRLGKTNVCVFNSKYNIVSTNYKCLIYLHKFQTHVIISYAYYQQTNPHT